MSPSVWPLLLDETLEHGHSLPLSEEGHLTSTNSLILILQIYVSIYSFQIYDLSSLKLNQSLRPRLVQNPKSALTTAHGIPPLDYIPRTAIAASILDAAQQR
mmetsp:Transcript_3943/g.7628  ORF Transcript_3943/g.7628 Transcript_3943/m.7628 type:complete len:102 (+) Transcript_3943:269-574(+)